MSCFPDRSKRRARDVEHYHCSPLHGHPGWHYNVTRVTLSLSFLSDVSVYFMEVVYSYYNWEIYLQAQAWLREQAQKEGWSKATKLHSRPMSQGLVGVAVNDKSAAVVEVPMIVLCLSDVNKWYMAHREEASVIYLHWTAVIYWICTGCAKNPGLLWSSVSLTIFEIERNKNIRTKCTYMTMKSHENNDNKWWFLWYWLFICYSGITDCMVVQASLYVTTSCCKRQCNGIQQIWPTQCWNHITDFDETCKWTKGYSCDVCCFKLI